MGCKQSTQSYKQNEKLLKIKTAIQDVKSRKIKNHNVDHNCKIVLLGNASVGKTSLASSYCVGSNKQTYGPTVGGVYFRKQFTHKKGGKMIVNIWDTAGEQKYRSMASLYYRDADVVMLVFDLTDLQSFNQLDYWIGELQYRIQKQDINIIIIGNKKDLPGRIIQKEDIMGWVNNYDNFIYKEVSAKTGIGIDDLFQTAIEAHLRHMKIHKK